MPPAMDDGYMLRKRTSPSDGVAEADAVLPKWPLNLWVDYDNLDWKVDDTGAVDQRYVYWHNYWGTPQGGLTGGKPITIIDPALDALISVD